MRVVRLLLLGLLVYVVSIIVLFPAAPVVDRIKPQLPQYVELNGVGGKLYNGTVASVRYTDDLLPVELSDVTWKLAPGALLKGGAGAALSFKGYGGGGEGVVQRQWNGDIKVNDFTFNARAAELEGFLPVPIARFDGVLSGDIAKLVLEKQLLTEMQGQIRWNDAVIDTAAFGQPTKASLGNLKIDIDPDGPKAQKVTLEARGGDVVADGTIQINTAGNFIANVLLTPSANAPVGIVNALQRIARPDASGRYRWQQSGNVNQMM